MNKQQRTSNELKKRMKQIEIIWCTVCTTKSLDLTLGFISIDLTVMPEPVWPGPGDHNIR